MMPVKPPFIVRAYLSATHLVPMIAQRHLQKRIARGKEHPTRWTEKLGQPSRIRPDGPLIWLHAVGLGEVLSLRGLIHLLADQTDAHFLVTSSTMAGAEAFASNAPLRTVYQFLPLDAPPYRRAFLDHWQPDLCIWAEQDIWPGFVYELAARNIPQALIAARMNTQSYTRHNKAKSLFSFIYSTMDYISAQDTTTASHLENLGATSVKITGSLKPSAPALHCDRQELARLRALLGDRFVWITAPAHQADVDLACAAQALLLTIKPDALLIVAPRFPDRPLTIDMAHSVRSAGEGPNQAVWLFDTMGELGLLYRLAQGALIGGSNDTTQGHNPWEAVALNTAIFYGSETANFDHDYKALDENGGTCVTSAAMLADALPRDLSGHISAARALREHHAQATAQLAQDLIAVMAANG